MDEFEAFKKASEIMETLADGERGRVMTYLSTKFNVPLTTVNSASPLAAPPKQTAFEAAEPLVKPKAAKKSKSVISMDKTLNLSPPGKPTAFAFCSEKAPGNVKQKCLVAVYYLRDFVGTKVTVEGVYTVFKALQWPLPSDLRNTLQQAGSEGWLDTADGQDIKLTNIGENVVEHQLPAQKVGK